VTVRSRTLSVAAALVAIAVPAVAQAPQAALRVALADAGLPAGCATMQAGPGKAFTDHLSARLERPVSLCGASDTAAAAASLAKGEADMALVDPAGFKAHAGVVRAILAPRPSRDTGRVLAVALTTKAGTRAGLDMLAGARPIFIADGEASRAVPLKALEDHGVPVANFGPALLAKGEDDGAAALRAGTGDVLILTAGAAQRLCRPEDQSSKPCDDLREIWRGRPTASRAFAVRNDMDADLRYRLVGIHIGLHFEEPDAMAYVAQLMPGSVALDPAEATALVVGPR
jgi:ABC-type phosphate/phosphonate transport system substrate-binding protein